MKRNAVESEMQDKFDRFRELYEDRWALNQGDAADKETPAFWDERAPDFAAKAHSAEARAESLEFLNRFTWSPNETVLDVAAGPGTFALPLAKMVKHVTVTDFSSGMLDQLLKQAIVEQVNNLEVIRGRWLEIDSPGVFDTVLCLNSLGVVATDAHHQPQLVNALTRLRDACSRRFIMLIPHADSPLDQNMRRILGLEEVSIERRRIAILYYAMVDCGMLPSLEIINRPFRWTFASHDEARKTLMRKAGVTEQSVNAMQFAEYVSTRLIRDPEGRFNLVYNVSQALFTWVRQP